MEARRAHSFACDRCRSGKRKCDAAKPECGLCKKLNKVCVYSTDSRPRKRKYWDEDYVRNLENQVQCLLSALKATGHDGLAVPTVPQDGAPEGTAASRFSTSGVEAEADDSFLPGAERSPPEPLATTGGDASAAMAHDGPGAARFHLVQERSEAAMEELSVMMWRTNIGDGVTIINDDSTGGDHKVESNSATAANAGCSVVAPASILAYCSNPNLLYALAQSFLDNINAEHQFTSYRATDFLLQYPNQRSDLAFLHSAILASGATFSHIPDQEHIGDEFARFAESLIFTCFRESPSIAVVQGLCILSERALALGRDHFGWIFISMAAGMSVHLRLHVLALDECAAREFKPSREDIRTFWMFYMTDRTAISILGRNCVLPWRRVNVPNFDTTFDHATADISDLSFAWQCKLWYLHDNFMDQIFSTNFETMPHAQQVQLLVSTHDALRTFYQSRDGRLDITPSTGVSKHVLFFHMAYQMAQLITLPPFLRCFTSSASPSSPSRSSKSSLPDEENVTVLILRSLTGAASTMIRLVRMYRDVVGWHRHFPPSCPSDPTSNATTTTTSSSSTTASSAAPAPAAHPCSIPRSTIQKQQEKPNPVIIHYLLSAAIVQLMNATSGSASLRKSSARQLRTCMELLAQLRGPGLWKPRADKSIKVIRVLAQRWGVLGALPMNYSYRVEPAEQVDVGMSSTIGQDVPRMVEEGGGGGGGGRGGRGGVGTGTGTASGAGGIPPTTTMSPYGSLTGRTGINPAAASTSLGGVPLGSSSWGGSSADANAHAAAPTASMFGMASMGMSSGTSPPTINGVGSLGETDFNFVAPNMTTNLNFFDMMAGGTYVNWMHEFEASNGYDWASNTDMNGTQPL